MQRVPGVIGLWEEPLPGADPLPAIGDLPPLPNGPAASALSRVPHVDPAGSAPTPLGAWRALAPLDLPDPTLGEAPDDTGDAFDQEPDDGLEIPDHHRLMHFMGTPVKIRSNPEWVGQARELAEAEELSPQQVTDFLTLLRYNPPAARAQIADLLMPFFRAHGRDELAEQVESLKNTSARQRAT